MKNDLDQGYRRRGWLIVATFAVMILYVFVAPGTAIDDVIFCPFHALTGYDCFGCGMTRACSAAIRGELHTSLVLHPFGVVFVLGFGAIAVHRLLDNLAGRRVDWSVRRWVRRHQNAIWGGALAFVLLYGVGRFLLEVTGVITPL